MPLESYPNIIRWLEGLARLPAWADPWPEQTNQQSLSAAGREDDS